MQAVTAMNQLISTAQATTQGLTHELEKTSEPHLPLPVYFTISTGLIAAVAAVVAGIFQNYILCAALGIFAFGQIGTGIAHRNLFLTTQRIDYVELLTRTLHQLDTGTLPAFTNDIRSLAISDHELTLHVDDFKAMLTNADKVGKELLRDYQHEVAEENTFNHFKNYLTQLEQRGLELLHQNVYLKKQILDSKPIMAASAQALHKLKEEKQKHAEMYDCVLKSPAALPSFNLN